MSSAFENIKKTVLKLASIIESNEHATNKISVSKNQLVSILMPGFIDLCYIAILGATADEYRKMHGVSKNMSVIKIIDRDTLVTLYDLEKYVTTHINRLLLHRKLRAGLILYEYINAIIQYVKKHGLVNQYFDKVDTPNEFYLNMKDNKLLDGKEHIQDLFDLFRKIKNITLQTY